MTELTSLIVGLGGLLLGALGLWFAHTERAKAYGDMLYGQQLASCRAVAAAASRLHYAIEEEYPLDVVSSSELSAGMAQRFSRLIRAEAAASTVLTENTLEALETYMNS